jgi:hypothetical protein
VRKIDTLEMLALWERGAPRHALDRSALLCAWARPDLPPNTVVDLPVGEVTATLLHLRAATFGPHIRAHVDCSSCAERLELNLLASELLHSVSADVPRIIEIPGMTLRAPSLRDMAAVATERDVEVATRRLIARCGSVADDTVEGLSDNALRAIEDAIELNDPNADLAFEVFCPACGQTVDAQLDVGDLLWDEIDMRARALLGEVHVLARAYGWTESEILALGPERRAAYLSMALA